MTAWIPDRMIGDLLDRLERRCHPSDYDTIREIRDLIESADASDDLLNKMIAGEKTGDADCDGIIARLAEHEELGALLEHDALASELSGATSIESVRAILKYASEQEAQVFALHDLAVSAGLIVPTDHKTDVLPLIAMFLPIEG